MSRGWFITGTDTAVGKTLVAAALIKQLADKGERVAGMKPVSCGCQITAEGLRHEDAMLLMTAANVEAPYQNVNPYAFAPAISPHLAAQQVGIKIELEVILNNFEILQQQSDVIVVEGVGGWMAPLGHVITNEHMARTLALPVILVVGLRLGCLNHTLLTARAIEAAGLPLAGWVANGLDPAMESIDDNITTIDKRLGVPMLGHIPYLEQRDLSSVAGHLSLP